MDNNMHIQVGRRYSRTTFAQKNYYRRWSSQTMLGMIDLFQQPLPAFNYRGQTTVASWPGGLVSFIIAIVMMIYGAIKLVQLLNRANPNVSSYVEQNFFDSSEVIDLKEKKIRFAFGIEGFLDKELKNDTRYVKNLVRMWGKKNGVPYDKLIPYHRCTEEDLNEFAPPDPSAEGMLNRMKRGGKSGLYCINWDEVDDDVSIWSIEDDDNY